jgi:predicted metal-dependent peptidase
VVLAGGADLIEVVRRALTIFREAIHKIVDNYLKNKAEVLIAPVQRAEEVRYTVVMMTTCDTDFNLDRHLVSFLQDSPFFAELSRHIQKFPTKSIPTAAVTFNEKTDELCLYWNPVFFGGGEYTDASGKVHTYPALSAREIRGVLTHEYYHLVFGHLYGRRRKPNKLWNVATDLAINSIIFDSAKNGGSSLAGDRPLPEFCLLPGVFPKHPDGRAFTAEEKAGMKLASIIEKLPTMQSSEWYFDKLKEELKDESSSCDGSCGSGEKGESGGEGECTCGTGDIDSMDDHSGWDDVPEGQREYVEGKVKSVVEKAVKHADSQSNGWGNIPAEMRDAIRKSVSNIINWRNVLRHFVGSITRGGRTTSIKRINKRYPYIHPGTKRGYTAKLLIAIDQSGSVGNEMLSEFFAELGSLTKKVTIDVVPFDTEAYEKDLYTWRRGADVPPQRVRCGGTDFDAPTRLANDPKNRGRWDGLLIMTDGECSPPVPSRIKRGYVIGTGRKLAFPTEDIVICMSKDKQTTGSWR